VRGKEPVAVPASVVMLMAWVATEATLLLTTALGKSTTLPERLASSAGLGRLLQVLKTPQATK
jgi:hypothetical protein